VHEVKVPFKNIEEVRSGKKRETKKKFFPIILVNMEFDDDRAGRWWPPGSRRSTV
jgi:transcription antitermination factor NusG